MSADDRSDILADADTSDQDAMSRHETYRRNIHEVEVRQPNEAWTLSWMGRSEMRVAGIWVETPEQEVFDTRNAVVEWMRQGRPTFH